MINIIQGATNSFALRLNDNITIIDPIFLFELTSIQSNQKFYFTPQDQSTSDRYNQFTFVEIGGTTQSVSLTSSVPYIELQYGGSYLYKVYQADSYDLSPTSTILDSGIAIFKNGEYEDFFFDIDCAGLYVYDGYVIDGYVERIECYNSIFNDRENFVKFDIDDEPIKSIFYDSETSILFSYEDDSINAIFDPEFVSPGTETYYILTELGDPILTESGDNLIWN